MAEGNPIPVHARSLQQTVNDLAAADITRVSTPEELRDSIDNNAQDIVIENHLDLTDLPLQDFRICPQGCENPLGLVNSRSIRGNCSVDLPLPGEARSLGLPLRPNQCILIAGSDLFTVEASQIWIDNLYMRTSYPTIPPGAATRQSKFANLIALPPSATPQGEHYVTRVTFEGDGRGPGGGLWADSDVYVEDSTFSGLGGAGVGECDECSASVIVRAHVSMRGCTFANPVEDVKSWYINAIDAGSVVVEATTFRNVTTPRVFAEINSFVYSDDPQLQVMTANNVIISAQPITNIPRTPRAGENFLKRNDPWFVNLKQVLVNGVVPVPADTGDGGGSDSTGVIIAVVVVAAVVLGAMAAAWLFIRRRRSRAAGQHALDTTKDMTTSTHGTASVQGAHYTAAGPYGVQSAHSGRDDSVQGSASGGYPFNNLLSFPSGQQSITASSAAPSQSHPYSPQLNNLDSMRAKSGTYEAPTGESFYTVPPTSGPPPGTDAPISTKLDFLHSQLNTFGRDDVVLGRFTLLGEMQRRQGGQGVVAFASGAEDRLEYAIKFFVVHASFVAERQLYESQALGSLLPRIEDVYDPANTPHRLLDRFGRALPPCIVMERGESLNEWSRRAKPDVFQSVAVLAHVATRLRDMHIAGFVHRDIKPSNIMLLPRENRWTVIDFGSTAAAGTLASLSYTLVYAAPEIAEAGATRVRAVVADPAADAWALGVVAFELLTGTATFDMLNDGKASVVAQLRGEEELPWEGERFKKQPQLRKRLGVFKSPVLALLHRDPASRASMQDFCNACNSLFSGPATSHAM